MPPIQPPVAQSTTGQPWPETTSPTASTFCFGKYTYRSPSVCAASGMYP